MLYKFSLLLLLLLKGLQVTAVLKVPAKDLEMAVTTIQMFLAGECMFSTFRLGTERVKPTFFMNTHFTVHNLFVVNNGITICMVSSSFLSVNVHLEMVHTCFPFNAAAFLKMYFCTEKNHTCNTVNQKFTLIFFFFF